MNDPKAEKYRRHADECHQEALRTMNNAEKRGWLKLAEFSRKMAARVVKKAGASTARHSHR